MYIVLRSEGEVFRVISPESEKTVILPPLALLPVEAMPSVESDCEIEAVTIVLLVTISPDLETIVTGPPFPLFPEEVEENDDETERADESNLSLSRILPESEVILIAPPSPLVPANAVLNIENANTNDDDSTSPSTVISPEFEVRVIAPPLPPLPANEGKKVSIENAAAAESRRPPMKIFPVSVVRVISPPSPLLRVGIPESGTRDGLEDELVFRLPKIVISPDLEVMEIAPPSPVGPLSDPEEDDLKTAVGKPNSTGEPNTVMFPSASRTIGPPLPPVLSEVLMLLTAILPAGCPFTGSIPARRIAARLLANKSSSDPEPSAVNVVSGPVMTISPVSMLPVASTFNATPV